MSKYGNLHIGVPEFKEEIYLLKDQLEKELITQSEYNEQMSVFNKLKLQWIAVSNDTSQFKAKYMKTKHKKLKNLIAEYQKEELDKTRDQLISEQNEQDLMTEATE